MWILLGLFNLILAAIYHYAAYQFQVTGEPTDKLVANFLMIVPPLLAVASFFVPTFWRLVLTGLLLLPLLAVAGYLYWSWKR